MTIYLVFFDIRIELSNPGFVLLFVTWSFGFDGVQFLLKFPDGFIIGMQLSQMNLKLVITIVTPCLVRIDSLMKQSFIQLLHKHFSSSARFIECSNSILGT